MKRGPNSPSSVDEGTDIWESGCDIRPAAGGGGAASAECSFVTTNH